jgi:hypothetical protein
VSKKRPAAAISASQELDDPGFLDELESVLKGDDEASGNNGDGAGSDPASSKSSSGASDQSSEAGSGNASGAEDADCKSEGAEVSLFVCDVSM